MLRRAAVVHGDDPGASGLCQSEGDRPIAEAGAKVISPAMQIENGTPRAIEPARLDGFSCNGSDADGFDQDAVRDACADHGPFQKAARPGDVESKPGMRLDRQS